jgi:hypothetical protein
VKGEESNPRSADPDDGVDVAIRIEDEDGTHQFGWQRVWHSQSMRHGVTHSPTGFSWGYGGSGPSQLAFAILMIPLGPERAKGGGLYHVFKDDTLARVVDQHTPFEFAVDIERWLIAHEQGDERRRRDTIEYIRGF